MILHFHRHGARTARGLALILLSMLPAALASGEDPKMIDASALTGLEAELVKLHGEAARGRISRGLRQAASLWRKEDGSGAAFAAFARDSFIADPSLLDAAFSRLERVFEEIDGHLNEIGREVRWASEVDVGPLLPIDRLLAAHDPGAHLVEDLFASKVAFTVLLNFPLTTLAERLEAGKGWSRRQWAEARLAQRFSKRIPAAVSQAITRASADGDAYIAEYNIWMHHLLDEDGNRLFPRGLRLISHWNLRDELKADYSEPGGIAKQRLIARVMERIVEQTIPRAVIDNPRVDWRPVSNRVSRAPAEEIEEGAPALPASAAAEKGDPVLSVEREPDVRYAHLLETFRAARLADPHSPATPTHIARRFEESREIPEARVRALLTEIISSPLVPRVAKLIGERLGRKLEPFDIWYSGFQPRGKHREADLDAIVSRRYPDRETFQRDIPRLLEGLGFSKERAAHLAETIAVDPARGAGHAMPAARRGDRPRLRTRIEKGGMNYKGYNIAVHELGHNVEQVFSLYHVDHTLLAGVPNNAFTEALAFVFQGRDLELLGLEKPDAESERLRVLNDFWMTYEICGPALLDMALWHWMYDHPAATPAELREATLAIARELWDQRYAPVLGGEGPVAGGKVLLAIYSHMVNLMMYLPDYPLGHLIAFQIEEHLRGGQSGGGALDLGKEFERMASYGSVAPDLWMEHATGSPVSAAPLLRATAKALE